MSRNLLTTEQVSERLSIKVATLRIWRMQGKGPNFLKIGALVRYDEAALDRYIDDAARRSTSQKAPTQAALA